MLRTLAPAQRSVILLGGPDLSEPETVFETGDILVEAPNWTLDGTALILNGDGLLWRLDPTGADRRLVEIGFTGLPPINNDHVLDPDGRHIYLSANDGHIYRGSLDGGAVERITPDDGMWHFLHGVSPDGRRLAYVGLADFDEPGRLYVLDADGSGAPQRIPAGDGHLDGPEWSPDGRWIHLNTESFSTDPGHAQLARIPNGGGDLERLVTSGTVDWFPHLSPDGALASYIAFPTGTLGHPADKEVVVHLVDPTDWTASLRRYPVFGGQGTINVNSWSPSSDRFAFVAYPID